MTTDNQAQPDRSALDRLQEIALSQDPVRFAQWISSAVLDQTSDERISALCPPPNLVAQLGITTEEQRASANEILLMTPLGACMFSGNNFNYEDHAAFKRQMAQAASRRIFGGHVESRIAEVEAVLDRYLSDLLDRTSHDQLFSKFSETFMDRVYPNNHKVYALNLETLAFSKVPLDTVFDTFSLTRDSYYQLRHGCSYESFAARDA